MLVSSAVLSLFDLLRRSFLLLYLHRYIFALCNKYVIHIARQYTMRTIRIHVPHSCIVRTTPQRSSNICRLTVVSIYPLYGKRYEKESWENNPFSLMTSQKFTASYFCGNIGYLQSLLAMLWIYAILLAIVERSM